MISKASIRYFFFVISLVMYYYIFLFFPIVKEITGAFDIPELYIMLKILSIIIFFITVIIQVYPKIEKLSKPLLLYLLYTLFNCLFLVVVMKYSLKYIILSFYDTFSIFFMAFIFLLIDKKNIPKIKEKDFLYLLSSLFLIVLVYGYLQKLFNSSLLFYEHDFYYISSKIHEIRVWSILPSRIEYGKAMALMSILAMFYVVYSKKNYKIQFFLLFILSLTGVYISTERTSLILVTVSIINLFLLKIDLKFSRIVLGNVILSIIFPFVLMSLTFQYTLSNSLLRTNSLIDRIYWWGIIIKNYILNGDIVNILFGYGIIQTTDSKSYSSVITHGKLWIDNLFFTIFLYQGIIGLILFLYMYISFIYKIYSLNTFYSKYFSITLLSWLIASVFARSIGDIALLTFLPSIIYLKYKERF